MMIEQKRNDLERFIREQILGPGGTGYRFVDMNNETLLQKDLLKEPPLEYRNELINSVPGAFYSTGILFPNDNSQTAGQETEPEEAEEEAGDSVSGTHDHIDTEGEEDQALSINQMYPNTMGLTCCLNQNIAQANDLKIKISARYYQKVERKILSERYGVLIELDPTSIETFIAGSGEQSIIQQKIFVKRDRNNSFLYYKDIKAEDISTIKVALRDIDKKKAVELGSDRPGQSLSGYKEFLFRKLKAEALDQAKKEEIGRTIEQIELTENIISHINDLINLLDGGYGLWKCEQLEKVISFPGSIPTDINGKVIYSYKQHKELHQIFKFDLEKAIASLSLNLQLSQDSRRKDTNLFLKVQLLNTSTAFTMTEDDTRYFSVFNEVVNQRSFFGVKIEVTSSHLVPYRSSVVDREKDTFDEDEVTKFLYRQYNDYGVGHGCSVKWNNDDKGSMVVSTEYIPSVDIPDIDPIPRNKEVLVAAKDKFEPEKIFQDTTFLHFKWLSTISEATDEQIIAGLKTFVNAYGEWINKKKKSYELNLDRSIALQELDKCETDKKRMLENIDLLLSGEKNKAHLSSFRAMNLAMFMQLWHSVKVKKGEINDILENASFSAFDEAFYKTAQEDLFEKGVPASWRPFQLAFILLNLDGIFQREDDPNWDVRNKLVDLVWFPTGGGKTEAYLGIIALTIIHRRRSNALDGGGTAVIMRYTLRLLTLQQFQRASLLIMALELMRRWDPADLGEEPIYIGLWVGKGSLPNSLEDLEKEYVKIKGTQEKGGKNISSVIPFENCPWCGKELKPISFEKINKEADLYYFNRVLLRCSREDHKCSFTRPLRPKNRQSHHGPIPVSLCDEEIYQHPPALLFGTVDKFAQLAHKVSNKPDNRHKDSRRLFGVGNWEEGKPEKGYLPPDLIIQDELHLLLGPLGSSVALFESAIDQLCTRIVGKKIIRPKIISSTATTRNTDLQIMALFDRAVNLFPKPGVECDDSFFAFYKRESGSKDDLKGHYLSKRKYVGFLPTGRTHIWMQMRLAAVLMTHRALFEMENIGNNIPVNDTSYNKDLNNAMDYYHTILSYFNSLKEVGKTESQIETYLLKEIRKVFNRVIRPGKMMHPLYTYTILGGELTGRLSGEDVKKVLDRVSSKWVPGKRFGHLDERSVANYGTAPPDFVVATNMISVGIDVSRFNTIIMNSMPRNIAEYIQASSRVARDKKGLVLTVHHPFRARDISHYEKFIEFHEKMYSYVEPISITPFTKKAISRYFGLYVATMLRHGDKFTERKTASHISSLREENIDALIKALTDHFYVRQENLTSMDVSELIKNLLQPESLEDMNKWVREAINDWKIRNDRSYEEGKELVFNFKAKKSYPPQEQLYVDADEYEANIHSKKWQIPQSLRVVEPEAVIKIKHK